jgi:branched-chain amino acid transport system substrate-binding protein
MEIKIAVLLPRSDMFPTLAMDFLNGLKLSLKHSDTPLKPEFLIEGLGNAADKNLLKVAEKMILQEDADLVISFCSIYLLEEMTSLFTNYKKPLIHVDLGGSIFKKTHVSPYVIHHTLNIAQSAYAAGMYAALNLGKKAYLAGSMYDGGYQISDSIVRGYEKEGGKVEKHYVSPMDYKSETFDALIADIEAEEPDVVFGNFSYKEGVKVFQRLASSSLNGKVPFMVMPVMTDESVNTEDYQMQKVSSMASWAFDEENPQMQDFLNSYTTENEDPPNIISLLGFEVGLTIALCVSSEGKVTRKLMEILQDKNIDSPRGTLKYNSFNESQVENFKLRAFTFNKTAYHNKVTETMDTSFSEALNEAFEDSIYSGWQNPYICT